jgi:hypothetical protein
MGLRNSILSTLPLRQGSKVQGELSEKPWCCRVFLDEYQIILI